MLNALYIIIKFITHLHLIQILRLIGVPNRYSAVASIEMLATAFLVSSDVEINPQFYWGKTKSFSDEKNGELYASRELHGIIKTV